MNKDEVYRKARYAVIKFAKAEWGQNNVHSVALDMVTEWDLNGYSRWNIELNTEYPPTSPLNLASVQVNHADFVVGVLESPAKAEEPAPQSGDEVEFEFMSDRTEVIRRYKVINAPLMANDTYRPASVKLTFVDGDLLYLSVYGYIVKPNGLEPGPVAEFPGIRVYDQSNWPEWLVKLRKRVSVHGLAEAI